jgi:hypothetical protein
MHDTLHHMTFCVNLFSTAYYVFLGREGIVCL